jgi:peptidoglycan hydrolase-like protein with peptidoglycan-binding domain
MRVVKTLLALILLMGLAGGAAYGTGVALHRHDQRTTTAGGTGGDPAARPTASPTPAPTTSQSPTPTPSTTPSPSDSPAPVVAVLSPGAEGTQVRELQQRLHQLAWLPETSTGVYDDGTATAVAGFQAKHGLARTGVLDTRTWHRLVALTEQPTHDAMFNVLRPGPTVLAAGDSGDHVRDLQARLKQLAWYFGDVTGTYDAATITAVKGFQAKRAIPVTGDADRRTLDRLDAMTTTPTHDALHNILPSPGKLDPRCLTGRVMCIDKTSRTLRWVVDGHVRQQLDARFGSTLNDTPTREGLFHVYLKDADHVSQLYGSSMPFAMFFSGGQAVHYSSDFATVGYAGASHGCVNIRDLAGVTWLFSQVRVGDKVVVYWS